MPRLQAKRSVLGTSISRYASAPSQTFCTWNINQPVCLSSKPNVLYLEHRSAGMPRLQAKRSVLGTSISRYASAPSQTFCTWNIDQPVRLGSKPNVLYLEHQSAGMPRLQAKRSVLGTSISRYASAPSQTFCTWNIDQLVSLSSKPNVLYLEHQSAGMPRLQAKRSVLGTSISWYASAPSQTFCTWNIDQPVSLGSKPNVLYLEHRSAGTPRLQAKRSVLGTSISRYASAPSQTFCTWNIDQPVSLGSKPNVLYLEHRSAGMPRLQAKRSVLGTSISR